MACTSPIRGVRGSDGVVRLKKGIPDARLFGTGDKPELELACGRCMDCKIRRANDWATRLTHEGQAHDRNCFLTLTFSDDGLALRELQRGTHPADLDLADWQLFAKRLRQELTRQQRRMEKKLGLPRTKPVSFRFFQVGEYGDDNNRPHYHALIFGQDFTGEGDRWRTETGHPAWTSRTIEKLWPYGFHQIQDLTPETINYVSRYVQKKLYGQRKEAALARLDLQTGEHVTVRPEFATMSRGGKSKKGGIGAEWFKRWQTEVFPDDFLVIQGEKKPVPRYYTELLKKSDEQLAEQVKKQREEKAKKRAADNTPEKRVVRSKVTMGKLRLKRSRKL